jgi:hypothetical protein
MGRRPDGTARPLADAGDHRTTRPAEPEIDVMRALSYLLGARAIDVATASERRLVHGEPPFLPIASTPEAASAWRRWAAEGRAEAGEPADAGATARRAAPAKTRPAPNRPLGDAA